MAEESGGTDWGSLISLVAGVLGAMSSGQSLSGEPSKQVSNVGPMTPEGQRIYDEYSKTLEQTPTMTSTRMGGVNATFPNKSRIGILKNMIALEALRRGTLDQKPAETGILGKLAPLLASMSGTKKDKDPWGGIKTYTPNYDANTVGYDPNFNQADQGWWMNSYGTSSGE